MTVREILARWPSTRGVFERAGLMGCGGSEGPAEELEFFANVHHVPLDRLREQLEGAIRTGTTQRRRACAETPGKAGREGRELNVAPAPALAFEPAHRYVPFLVSAIALTLTFGATLGMINLARLTTPWFGGMPMGSVRAHAFVQVFGFVGLFVMGIACHVLPRFASRPLAAPWLVRPMLGLQIAGVLAMTAAFMLEDDVIQWAWAAGSVSLITAGGLFALLVVRTIRGLGSPERFERWVIAGALWLAIAAGLSLVAAIVDDVTSVQVLWPAALWGFAGSWILGIGRRIFPGFLRWQPRFRVAETPAFVSYQTAVALATAAAWPFEQGPPLLLVGASSVGLLVSVPLFSWCIGVRFRDSGRHDREGGYQRYIATGWMWLFVALAVGPLWTLVTAIQGSAPAPLVTDFARHAFAFGFVAQIMMGVATRILPVFTGNALWSPRARAAAFSLLNLSVVLRALELVVAAGIAPDAWPIIATAGPPAVGAVLLFALNVVFTIFGRPGSSTETVAGKRPLAERTVAQVLEIPGALDVLVEAGFTPLKNAVARATMARSVTLAQACGLKGIPLDPLVARLEELARTPSRIAS